MLFSLWMRKSTISYTFPSDDNIHQLQNTEMSGARNTIISLQSELWILRQMRGELVVRRWGTLTKRVLIEYVRLLPPSYNDVDPVCICLWGRGRLEIFVQKNSNNKNCHSNEQNANLVLCYKVKRTSRDDRENTVACHFWILLEPN